jgi:cullin 1
VSLGLDQADFRKSTLEIYTKHFQTPFIDASEVYYQSESEKFISENTVIDYMKKVLHRLFLSQSRLRLDSHKRRTELNRISIQAQRSRS